MEAQVTMTERKPRSARHIVLAEIAGFCFGVRRAVEITEAARREQDGRLTTLGPIIHNEQVIDRMKAQGIETAPTLDAIEGGTVVLSAHGVAPTVVEQARSQGLKIIDVTCPFVTKVHRMAQQLYQQGYQLLMVGDQGHTEVKGVVGSVESIGGKIAVISSLEQLKEITLSKKVGLVCQTTQLGENWGAIVGHVSQVANDVRAINTICNATDELQEAAVRLSRQVEVVIVVGGRKSANTCRLRQLCEDQGVPAYHVETAAEIQEEWLVGKTEIGLTAGASTPDWLIESVARHLNEGELPVDWRLHHPDE